MRHDGTIEFIIGAAIAMVGGWLIISNPYGWQAGIGCVLLFVSFIILMGSLGKYIEHSWNHIAGK